MTRNRSSGLSGTDIRPLVSVSTAKSKGAVRAVRPGARPPGRFKRSCSQVDQCAHHSAPDNGSALMGSCDCCARNRAYMCAIRGSARVSFSWRPTWFLGRTTSRSALTPPTGSASLPSRTAHSTTASSRLAAMGTYASRANGCSRTRRWPRSYYDSTGERCGPRQRTRQTRTSCVGATEGRTERVEKSQLGRQRPSSA